MLSFQLGMSHLHDAGAAWRNTPGQHLKGHSTEHFYQGESVHRGEFLALRNPTEVSKRIIRAVFISVGYFFRASCTSCVLPQFHDLMGAGKLMGREA